MIRVLATLIAASAALASQARSEPLDVSAPYDIASLLLLGVGASGGASGYLFPAVSGVSMWGDSRIAQSIGASSSGGTFTSSQSLSTGYGMWAVRASGNNLLPTTTSGYGVGATTSLNLRDRMNMAAMVNGLYAITPSASATGAETLASPATTTGGFAGYLTPGTLAANGWVKVTFGAAGSVGSTCGSGSGYTPFTVTDSNGDTIPGWCVADSYSATATYGSTTNASYALRNWSAACAATWSNQCGVWANFTVTQPTSGARAQAGDTFAFTTFGGQARAYSVTGIGAGNPVDASWNTASGGLYAPPNDPSNIVLLLDSVNDKGTAFTSPASGSAYGQCPGPDYSATYPTMLAAQPCLSMANIAKTLDLATAAGKVVFLADEEPVGMGFAHYESKTVTAGATTVTAANAATFKYDGSQFSNSSTLAGAVPALPGLVAVVGGVATPYTYVASAPGVGQYTISAGVYSFSASDPLSTSGGTALLTYSFGTGSTDLGQRTMHAWLHSSAANFSYNGTSYNFSGALYNRPNVISVPLFEWLVDRRAGNWDPTDPDCVSHPCAAAPGVYDTLSLHPSPFGGALFGQAFKAALATTPYGSLPDNSQLPAYNNIRCAKSSGGVGPYACTIPPTMMSAGHPSARLCYGSAAPLTCVDDCVGGSTGSWTGCTNVGGGTNADISASSINYSTGAVSVTFSSGHAPTVNTYLDVLEDKTNFLMNPMFDPTAGIGYSGDFASPCVGSGLTNLPASWYCTISGSTGLTFTWATGTNAAGAPTLSVTITGTPTAAGTLTISSTTTDSGTNAKYLAGNKLRAGVVATFAPYNGTLSGVYSQYLWQGQAPSFTYPNFFTVTAGVPALAASTNWKAVGDSVSTSSAYPWSNLMLGIPGYSGGVTLSTLTSPIDATAMSPTSATTAQAVSWVANQPVSVVFTVAQAQVRVRN